MSIWESHTISIRPATIRGRGVECRRCALRQTKQQRQHRQERGKQAEAGAVHAARDSRSGRLKEEATFTRRARASAFPPGGRQRRPGAAIRHSHVADGLATGGLCVRAAIEQVQGAGAPCNVNGPAIWSPLPCLTKSRGLGQRHARRALANFIFGGENDTPHGPRGTRTKPHGV
jgi:hypothetical protein